MTNHKLKYGILFLKFFNISISTLIENDGRVQKVFVIGGEVDTGLRGKYKQILTNVII